MSLLLVLTWGGQWIRRVPFSCLSSGLLDWAEFLFPISGLRVGFQFRAVLELSNFGSFYFTF